MSNQEHTQHKNRPKLITLLLSMLLVLSMLVPTVIAPLEAHATGTDVGGQDSSFDGETTSSGVPPSWDKSGWLFYVCDSNRQVLTPVLFFLGKNRSPSASYDRTYLTSRIGNQSAIATGLTAPWGPPILDGGSNWEAVKAAMDKNGLSWVRYYFGEPIYEKVKSDDKSIHVILEVVAWGKKPGMSAGDNAVASASGWARMAAAGGCKPNSDFSWQYLNKIQRSEYLEYQWEGLDPPPTYFPSDNVTSIPNNLLLTYSYGMARLGTNPDAQTTCDEPKQPEPHEPPNESTGTFKIVKSYRIYNETTGVYTDSGTFVKPDSSPNITIEDESEYKLIEWKTSTTYKPDVLSTEWHKQVPGIQKQGGKSPTTIEMKSPETTLYVLLQKPENLPNTSLGKADFIMSQSTITRKIKLSYPDNTGLKLIKDHTFKWTRPAHKFTCEHTHTWKSGTDSEGNDKHDSHTVSCTWGKFTDNHTKLSLKNSKKSDYPDIVATKAGWENVTTTGLSAYIKRYQEHNSGHLRTEDYWNHSDWDYSCVLLRGKDKLTVASWKNTDLGTEAANTDLAGVSDRGFSIGNSTNQNRKKTNYFESFKTYFEDDSPDLNTTYSTTAGVSCHGGNNCGENTRTFSLSNPLAIDVGVLVETYSGDISQGTIDSTCDSTPTSYGAFTDISALSNKNMVRGLEVPSGANLSFRPYIQMNYDVQTAKHEPYSSSTQAHKTAYVLGDIQRGMAPNDYAEVSWKSRNSDKPNLTLNSLQWSTHSSVVDYVRGMGLNLNEWTALPGGATLDLTIKDSDKQVVMATTYQCIVDGSGKTQIDNAGGSYTGLEESDATSAHEAYVDSVISGLDALNVEQWVTTNIETNKHVWDINGSSSVSWGENLDAAGHPDQTASLEAKYYFSADGGRPEAPASEGDLDVEEKGTTTKKYTFFTNTKGEIRYTVDDVNPNIGSETKGNLANDSIANQINQRTHVVDKLQAAVEQGTGVDKTGRSKTGEHWYNEAFDGITVYVQTTELSLGYIDPPARSTVLDVKITQTQDNQSDMFNRNKYNMSQYRTKPYSDAYMENNVVGTFKGNSVAMKDMHLLFFSKKFLIPNATVDDLH